MTTDAQASARAEFDAMVRDVRPDLHRYCSRMVGSAIEGEDITQEALARAYYQLSRLDDVADLRGWLFRVAHNRAVDHLRRHEVRFAEPLDHELPAPDAGEPLAASDAAEIGLSYFVKLTPMQRSSVILKDVLGCSMEEISGVLDVSVAAIKGALRRGRAGLRRMAQDVDESAAQPLSPGEERLLRAYADRFNARDFAALQEMLADDVRLELVDAHHARGAESVRRYFGNYGKVEPVRATPGVVEGRPALLVSDPPDAAPGYFILIEADASGIRSIRDFRYARHVLAEAGRGEAPGRGGAPSAR